MTLNKDATALVKITGLTICKKNDAQKRWECLFLHPVEVKKQHRLELEIVERNNSLPNGESIYGPVDHTGRQITITVSKPAVPASIEYNNGSFLDDDDLNWGINFNAIHPEATTLRSKPYPVSYVSLTNCVFFSQKRSKYLYKLQRGIMLPKFKRQITDYVGAIIKCNPKGSITIEIRNKDGTLHGQPIQLEEKAGTVYDIIFDNDCEGANCIDQIDFPHYYEVFDIGASTHFDLSKAGSPPGEGVSRNTEAACNPVTGNPTTDFHQYFMS